MDKSKRLYFIPIIERALRSDDQESAMAEAFEEIERLGKLPQYKEGFRQFQEFIHISLKLSNETRLIHGLMHELATDTYEGGQQKKEALIAALEKFPEWYREYGRIKEEAEAFLSPETPLDVEILKDGLVIGSFPASIDAYSISSVRPGTHMVRLSNGRVLWEGDIKKEDIIWSFAFPEKDLPMAAETEPYEKGATRSIPLLNGEIVMEVIPGLESGEIRISRGQGK
jgi:hypothetical protein